MADFALRIAGFTLVDAKQLRPEPTVTQVKGLPQFPPFPDYAMAGITWPAPSPSSSSPSQPSG